MRKRGFTLVELLVVVAIIGILATIMIPNVKEQLRRAKVTKTKSLISSLSLVVTTYKNDFGKYPPSYDPQAFFKAILSAKTSYEPSSDESRFLEKGEPLWRNNMDPSNDNKEQILRTAGVPIWQAQEDENVFTDAWGNTLYFISSEIYNPGGKAITSVKASQMQACAYELKGDVVRPYNSKTFQLCSFGPDQVTYLGTGSNKAGLFFMIPTDKKDNDGDGKFDNEDRAKAINTSFYDDPEFVAEDDVTNF